MGADEDAAAVLARDPASHARLDDPEAVASLLRALHEAGADQAAAALASRAAADAPLDSPGGVAVLLQVLHEAGGDEVGAARTLASRAAVDAPLDDPGGVARLLGTLRAMGAGAAACTLADRAAADARLNSAGESPDCCGVCARWGPTKTPLPYLPATPPATPASTTQRPSPRCYGPCTRPGPTRPPLPWPAGPPPLECSTFSAKSVRVRPPASSSAVSRTERHRGHGDGRYRVSRGHGLRIRRTDTRPATAATPSTASAVDHLMTRSPLLIAHPQQRAKTPSRGAMSAMYVRCVSVRAEEPQPQPKIAPSYLSPLYAVHDLAEPGCWLSPSAILC